MSGVDAVLPAASVSGLLPGVVRSIWQELPAVLAVCLVWSLAAAPFVVALMAAAPWWITAGAVLPSALACSGLAAVMNDLRQGEPIRARRMAAVDPVLALMTGLATFTGAALLTADGWLTGLGYVGFAVLALVLPTIVAYGAIRDCQGFAAVRGGLMVAMQQPGVSVSLVGLGILFAFAAVATAGVLALVVPAIFALFTARTVAARLP